VGYKCAAAQELKTVAAGAMFTKDIFFGMNILSLLRCDGAQPHSTPYGPGWGAPVCIALMCVGTALVFLGLYSGALSN